MPSSHRYGSFANYSPHGVSTLSKQSRGTCAGIKRGRADIIESAVPYLKSPVSAVLQPFLGPDVTLVPAPRAAPLSQDGLWPGRLICDILLAHGFGAEIQPCLERVHAVPPSSDSYAIERPSVHEHMNSMRAVPPPSMPEKITIVDDILTLGRTAFACAELMWRACPDAEIRIFAMIRTRGLQGEIEKIVDPSTGTIRGYPSGKTHRKP